jgi:hypothetical protein
MDYLITMVKESGISPENKVLAIDLMAELIKCFPDWEFKQRVPGGDIPVKDNLLDYYKSS